MARQTVYCVQAFWRDKRKLAKGGMRQFKTEEEGRRSALKSSASNAGVVLFSVEGDAEFDDWSEPKVLATYGEVPEVGA